MKTVKNEMINEIVINKSRFIGILCYIKDKDDALEKINFYKGVYKNATHYCYGYIVGAYSKCSDDKEPSGTAGMPILNVLEKNDLNYVLCLVIRYFGGVKLGAGGLVRAYSACARDVVLNANIKELIECYRVIISFGYDDIKYFDYLLKDYDISKSFDKDVIYEFNIPCEKYAMLEDGIKAKAIDIKKEITFA